MVSPQARREAVSILIAERGLGVTRTAALPAPVNEAAHRDPAGL